MAPGNDLVAARAVREAYSFIPNSCQASPGLDPASAHFHEFQTRFNELSVVRKKKSRDAIPRGGKGVNRVGDSVMGTVVSGMFQSETAHESYSHYASCAVHS